MADGRVHLLADHRHPRPLLRRTTRHGGPGKQLEVHPRIFVRQKDNLGLGKSVIDYPNTGGEGRGLRDTHHGGAAEGGRLRGPRKEGRAAQQNNELDDKNHMNLDCFESGSKGFDNLTDLVKVLYFLLDLARY